LSTASVSRRNCLPTVGVGFKDGCFSLFVSAPGGTSVGSSKSEFVLLDHLDGLTGIRQFGCFKQVYNLL